MRGMDCVSCLPIDREDNRFANNNKRLANVAAYSPKSNQDRARAQKVRAHLVTKQFRNDKRCRGLGRGEVHGDDDSTMTTLALIQASSPRTQAHLPNVSDDWELSPQYSSSTESWARSDDGPHQEIADSQMTIAELRRLTGLTWEQLARMVGVSRRTLHFWTSGKPINASNEEHLQRLLVAIRKVDQGSAKANRTMLFQDHDGVLPFDLLSSGNYERCIEVVGVGRGRQDVSSQVL